MRRYLLVLVPVLLLGGALLIDRNPSPTISSPSTYRPDGAAVEDCDGDVGCNRQAYANLVYREGARVALARLRAAMSSDPETLRQCHQIAHWMGGAGLLRADGDLAQAFVEGDETCGSGYWHGLMQARVGGLLAESAEILNAELDSICTGDAIRVSPWIAWQCVHGLGHGLLIARDYDLPVAIEGCEVLSRPWDVEVCANGVFMENALPSLLDAPRDWVSDIDPEAPCDRVGPRHQDACYQYSSNRALQIANKIDKALALCLRFTSQWVDKCIDGLGRLIGANNSYLATAVGPVCDDALQRRVICVTGSAVDSFQNDTLDLARAASNCGLLQGDEFLFCWRVLGEFIGTTTKSGEDPAARCIEAPDKRSRAACADGARASYERY